MGVLQYSIDIVLQNDSTCNKCPMLADTFYRLLTLLFLLKHFNQLKFLDNIFLSLSLPE